MFQYCEAQLNKAKGTLFKFPELEGGMTGVLKSYFDPKTKLKKPLNNEIFLHKGFGFSSTRAK